MYAYVLLPNDTYNEIGKLCFECLCKFIFIIGAHLITIRTQLCKQFSCVLFSANHEKFPNIIIIHVKNHD